MNPPTDHVLDSHLRNEWKLSLADVDKCEHYFLRKWQLGYFLDQMDANPMSLTYNEIEYHIIFVDNLNWKEHWTQVMLSFRKPALGNKAYVLVKGYSE